MWNELPSKRSVGLALALVATAISGTNVLAAPAPLRVISERVPEIPWEPLPGIEPEVREVNEIVTFRSPETGLNVRVPGLSDQPTLPGPIEPPGQRDPSGSITVGSPQNGLNVRVPAL